MMDLSERWHFSILPKADGQCYPCPELLTEEEAISFLRLDIEGPKNPQKTLEYYRNKKLLRATRVGRKYRYQRSELLRFLDELTQKSSEK